MMETDNRMTEHILIVILAAVICLTLSGCTSLKIEHDGTIVTYRYLLTNKALEWSLPDGSQVKFGAQSDSNVEALGKIAEMAAMGAVKGAK